MDTLPTNQLTILFADIAGSTRLYELFGDLKARDLITDCLSFLKKLAPRYNGAIVKTIGDEAMCKFLTPNFAAEAAIQMQEAITSHPKMVQANIHLRIGFHHGEVICEPNDVFGDAVNVAARMVALAKSDQIITNKETLELMKPYLKHQPRLVDRTRVRGKDDIVEIHELIWGMPDQMTMACDVTEEMIASLTGDNVFLQIRHANRRILVSREKPILDMGRGTNNHLAIDNRLVSRMHARIEIQRRRFIIVDQSTNGTYVQPSGEDAIFLRRDTTQLRGKGLIGLGQRVRIKDPVAVRYEIL